MDAEQVTLVSDSYHSRRLGGHRPGSWGWTRGVAHRERRPRSSSCCRETGLVAVGQVIGYGRLLRLAG